MKLSANLSVLFTEQPLLERIQAAACAGFAGVEIQFPYDVAAVELKAHLHAAQLPLVLINIPAGDFMSGGLGLAAVPERIPAFDQALEQALRYAECVQPEKVNLLAGRLAAHISREQALETLAANVSKAAQRFADLGIGLCCEAIKALDMPGFLINTPQELARLLAEVDHPNCLAQVDIYHFARQGFAPQSLGALAGRIGHVQFADCPGRAQPGTGDVDFNAWIEVLKAYGYDQWLSAEYRPSGVTGESLEWLPQWQQCLA